MIAYKSRDMPTIYYLKKICFPKLLTKSGQAKQNKYLWIWSNFVNPIPILAVLSENLDHSITQLRQKITTLWIKCVSKFSLSKFIVVRGVNKDTRLYNCTLLSCYIVAVGYTLRFCSIQILASLQTKVPAHPTSTRHCRRLEMQSLLGLSHAFWMIFSYFRVLGRCPEWQVRSTSWPRTWPRDMKFNQSE